MAVPLDAVDQIKAQWQQERPELSLQAMGILGRLRLCAVLYAPLSDSSFGKFGLTAWEFDVLATLRRAGAPYTLTPTELFSTLMVTSGTMTHRLKGLETRAFIERSDNLDDARNRLVTLSLQGLSTIDAAMTAHVDTMEGIMSGLNLADQVQLNHSLTQLLALLETQSVNSKPALVSKSSASPYK
jgi:DNA-binding MarR family transcriptional regulator